MPSQDHSADSALSAAAGNFQEAGDFVLLAELGSLSLEFSRLSQISEDPRYFDAIQRITDDFDRQQENTKPQECSLLWLMRRIWILVAIRATP